MGDESKPPMRQIAELIEGIATARAESAERLLGECETQLIETRAHLGDMVGRREAEIARLEEYVGAANETAGNAIREVIDLRRANAQLDAEIARLETELAEQRADRVAALGRYLSEWDAGRVPIRIEPAPPAEDPRIAALIKPLCIVVTALVNHTWKRETDDGLSESVCKAIAQIAWRE